MAVVEDHLVVEINLMIEVVVDDLICTELLVVTVVIVVKFHLNQVEASLYSAVIVLKNKVVAVEIAGLATEMTVVVDVIDQGLVTSKCIVQLVISVVVIVKYHLSLLLVNQSFVIIVLKKVLKVVKMVEALTKTSKLSTLN